MAIPPVAVALPDDQILAYFRSVLDAVDLPVVVQDASGYLGRPLPIALYAALLDEYGPDRVLFKPEAVPIGPRLSALREATGGTARVFEGTGGLALVDSHRRGIVGTMPGPEVPWALVALWRALEQGDQGTVDALHGPLAALVSLQTSLDSFIAVEKHLLVSQGVFTNDRRRPPHGADLDPETVARGRPPGRAAARRPARTDALVRWPMSVQSVDPRTGEAFGPVLPETSAAELDAVVTAAVAATVPWAEAPAGDAGGRAAGGGGRPGRRGG